jgi:F0F1-type ATP synthase membrane subunit b/b'
MSPKSRPNDDYREEREARIAEVMERAKRHQERTDHLGAEADRHLEEAARLKVQGAPARPRSKK